jgi:hypothetical protein
VIDAVQHAKVRDYTGFQTAALRRVSLVPRTRRRIPHSRPEPPVLTRPAPGPADAAAGPPVAPRDPPASATLSSSPNLEKTLP